MKRGMKVFLTWVLLYALSVLFVCLGAYFLNRGNTTAGAVLLILGILYFWSLRQYEKKEKKKAPMREAFVEASKQMSKPPTPSDKTRVKTNNASQQAVMDPVERISKLKELLNKGLIDSDEFEKKKADILSEM